MAVLRRDDEQEPCTCALAQGGAMTGFDNCPRHRVEEPEVADTRRNDEPVFDSYRTAWMRRGRELNSIYDALTCVVGRSPNGDPIEDIHTLGAEVERLREALDVLPSYLTAANVGDGGAIPLALDIIKAALCDRARAS